MTYISKTRVPHMSTTQVFTVCTILICNENSHWWQHNVMYKCHFIYIMQSTRIREWHCRIYYCKVFERWYTRTSKIYRLKNSIMMLYVCKAHLNISSCSLSRMGWPEIYVHFMYVTRVCMSNEYSTKCLSNFLLAIFEWQCFRCFK